MVWTKESFHKTIPFLFLFSIECISWYWVGWSDWKKKKTKKNHKNSQNRRPWYPKIKVNIHIFELTKCTICCKNVPVFVPVFLYTVTMLIFQIKRIIPSKKWFNYIATLFLKIPKIWVSWTMLNREKKGDGLRKWNTKCDHLSEVLDKTVDNSD